LWEYNLFLIIYIYIFNFFYVDYYKKTLNDNQIYIHQLRQHFIKVVGIIKIKDNNKI